MDRIANRSFRKGLVYRLSGITPSIAMPILTTIIIGSMISIAGFIIGVLVGISIFTDAIKKLRP